MIVSLPLIIVSSPIWYYAPSFLIFHCSCGKLKFCVCSWGSSKTFVFMYFFMRITCSVKSEWNLKRFLWIIYTWGCLKCVNVLYISNALFGVHGKNLEKEAERNIVLIIIIYSWLFDCLLCNEMRGRFEIKQRSLLVWCTFVFQGCHRTGRTANLVVHFSGQGKHREFT